MGFIPIIIFGIVATISFGAIIIWAACDKLRDVEKKHMEINDWLIHKQGDDVFTDHT